MAATQFSRPFTIWDCLDHRRPLGRRIETERRRLQKANAVLVALECALNEEEIAPIVAADAANIVRRLIDYAIERLDTVSLARGEAMPATTDEPTERGQQATVRSELNDADDESKSDGAERRDDDELDVEDDDTDD